MPPHTKAFSGGAVTGLPRLSIYAVDNMSVDSDGEKKVGPILWTTFDL